MNYETQVWPAEMVDLGQWVTWQYIDGRKQPHSMWSELENTMSWSKPGNWADFATAHAWATKVPQLEGVGFIIQHPEEPYREPADPYLLIDFDDVRDPDTGATHARAREIIAHADSYADVSTSETGAHIIGRGSLPGHVRTIQDDLPGDSAFPDAEIEVYEGKRFVAMTGYHIEGTPEKATDISDLIPRLVDQFDTNEQTPTDYTPPEIDNDEYADVDVTDDIDDVTDAIRSVGPGDIRLQSEVTNERADGTRDYDPSWANSDSGTRLAAFPGGGFWWYRDGEHALDALQVVALEERLIHRPIDYPEGERWWQAVERLRERGANIPRYAGNTSDVVGYHASDNDELDEFVKAGRIKSDR